jgi:predicted ATP-binding protein involved in virulence
MRAKRVLVTDLFGLFEHDIELKLNDHITILHGPNGYGKTVILKMIEGLLTSSFEIFLKVPFKHFELELDDSSCYTVEKLALSHVTERQGKKAAKGAQQSVRDAKPGVTLSYRDPNGISTAIKRAAVFDLPLSLLREIDRHLPPYINLVGRSTWLDSAAGIRLTLQEVIERWGDILRSKLPWFRKYTGESDPHLKKLQTSINVRFISTQRLERLSSLREREQVFESSYESTGADRELTAVEQYSTEIVSRFRAILAKYAAISSELDRTFPERLLLAGQQTDIVDKKALQDRFAELQLKRARLIDFGFLDDKEGSGLSNIPESLYETRGDVLSVYMRDTQEKLNTFEDMAASVGLFTKIINERFTYKRLKINRDKGFVFESNLGELEPTALSSGEQHELVLLYELLFKVDKTWLVLLDEPEISLHVGWQQQFLDDLQEIVKLSNVDVIMATHSPVVIGDHWDLTVELKGPVGGKNLTTA